MPLIFSDTYYLKSTTLQYEFNLNYLKSNSNIHIISYLTKTMIYRRTYIKNLYQKYRIYHNKPQIQKIEKYCVQNDIFYFFNILKVKYKIYS